MGKLGDIGIIMGLGIVGGVLFMFATGRWKFPELKFPEFISIAPVIDVPKAISEAISPAIAPTLAPAIGLPEEEVPEILRVAIQEQVLPSPKRLPGIQPSIALIERIQRGVEVPLGPPLPLPQDIPAAIVKAITPKVVLPTLPTITMPKITIPMITPTTPTVMEISRRIHRGI